MSKSKYRAVPVESVHADPQVNRDIREAKVERMVANWNPTQVGTPVVSRRENGIGEYFVALDGQHRIEAQRRINPKARLMCEVREDLTLADEALLFVKLNSDRTAVRPIDRFLKGITGKDERSLAIKEVTEIAGFRVAIGGGDEGVIRCVTTLERIYDQHGEKHILAVLNIISAAWGRGYEGVDGYVVEGIARLLHRYGDQLDSDVLVTKLKKFPGGAGNLIGTAKASKQIHGSSLVQNVASVIVNHYNKGRRSSALADWWAK